MDNKSFWLIDINGPVVTVSLVSYQNNQYVISGIGPATTYESDKDSFVSAVDISLSSVSDELTLTDEQEPDAFALIISPFWVGSDGKIAADKLKLIESLRHDLKLSPMGFIAYDEAVVEEANRHEGFPASFVLVNLNAGTMTVSLVYLGKIKERISKPIPDGIFDPYLLESAILELKSDSALPPQILLFGNLSDDIVESVKNFSWIGKKDIESFLHFPEIRTYSYPEIVKIYLLAISYQFQPPPASTPESSAEIKTEVENNLVEVDAADLGFGQPNDSVIEDMPVVTPPPPKKKLPKIKFPVIKLPRLHPSKFLIYFIIISPLLLLVPFLFSKATVTLYLTPYSFSQQQNITLDPDAVDVDINRKIIPVGYKTFDIATSATVATTGQKTIGDRARGEVVVYNKQSSVQDIPKGAILIDEQGHKFETETTAQIAASSSDLDAGIITLGQTRVSLIAADIGPEFNIAADSAIQFKDYPESALIARLKTPMAGGSRSQIQAVSNEDKVSLENAINADAVISISERVTQETAGISGIINDLQQIKKGRIDYNREIGEQADQLTGNLISTIKIYYLDPQAKLKLINAFLGDNNEFKESDIDIERFNLTITSAKFNNQTISGMLTIDGQSNPKIDRLALAKSLAGKFRRPAINLIKSQPRLYNYQISTNFSFLSAINPLPFRLQNITIEVK